MKLCIAGIQFQNLETGEIITFSPETKGVTVDSGRNPTEDEYNIASLASGVIVNSLRYCLFSNFQLCFSSIVSFIVINPLINYNLLVKISKEL